MFIKIDPLARLLHKGVQKGINVIFEAKTSSALEKASRIGSSVFMYKMKL